jgi:hypothetical protein
MNKQSIWKAIKYLVGLLGLLIAILAILFFLFLANFRNGNTISANLVDGRGIEASKFEPSYSISENVSDNESCSFGVSAILFLDSKKHYAILEPPPVGVTFQGIPVTQWVDRGGMISGDMTKLPCQHGWAEFVVTDYQGGKRVDRYNLSQAKFSSATKSIVRSKTLHIKLLDVNNPNDVNRIEAIIVDERKMQHRFEVYNLPTHPYKNEDPTELAIEKYSYGPGKKTNLKGKDRPYFDTSTQTLVIPPRILSYLQGKTAKIELRINIELPGSADSSLSYSYSMPALKLELK